MIERIKSVLAERGCYTLDLYRHLEWDGSFDAFSLFMNAGLERGDWESVDGFWRLPNLEPEPKVSPLTTEVEYLINESRQLKIPEDKNSLDKSYFKAENYKCRKTLLQEMLWANVAGYQIVPGEFIRNNEEGRIRGKDCWASQQVFMLEFDDNVKEKSFDEIIANHKFIRENAVALIESIRSGYDDPSDDTCNGEMRYRAFFLCPNPTNNIKQAEFFVKFLLGIMPTACLSGSTLTNGAFGKQNANIHIHLLNQFVSTETMQAFANAWRTEQGRQDRFISVPSEDISELPQAYSDAISELEFDSDRWSRTMLPCAFSQHQHDDWNSQRNAMGVFRHTDNKGYTLRCFKCGEKRSYRIKPRKQGKQRVKKTADSEAVYASLDDALIDTKKFWDFIATPPLFTKKRRAVLVRSDTGVGKDYAMLMEAKRSDVMSLNPHSALSIQLHKRAENEGIRSYHIKSRMHGFQLIDGKPIDERIQIYKDNDQIMCIHADRCEALLTRTGNCKDVLCNENDCEVYSFCSRNRYVSQLRRAAQYKIVHYSWPQLPTDPGSEGIVAQVMSERRRLHKDAPIWVVGEVDALKLLNVHYVSIHEIEKGVKTWGDEPAGQLYQVLGELCQPQLTPEQRFEKLVEGFKDIPKTEAIRQLSKVGMPTDGYTDEISVSQAISNGFVSIQQVSDIHKIPKVYPRHWTLVQRIEQLINFCMNDDPPIYFDSQSIFFVTPPILHSMCDTYVMQSATANSDQIKSLITSLSSDVDFFVGAAGQVEHHPGTQIYKIATGRYVRSSCFTYDSEWEITGLRDSIRPHLENLLSILNNTPGKKYVNTYKAIYDGEVLADDGLIELLRNVPNTTWSNWQSGYGMDLDPSTVLIEFGTNEPSAEQLKMACSQIYMMDTEPLSYDFVDYHEHDGIRVEGVRTYIDKRVQDQYEQMVSLAQYQMANRTRPIRNPSVVLIYSSHPCKWLDTRVQWVLPQMLGSNLRDLDVSYEEKSDFQKSKELKKELIIELAKEGLSNIEIATQLNYKSEKSIRNLLRELEL